MTNGPRLRASTPQSVTFVELFFDLVFVFAVTQVTVLTAHDLTLAARFADRLILISDGEVVADGSPGEVLTKDKLTAHYGADIRVLEDPDGPVVVPVRRST